jgi:hypothetical protein
VAVRVVAAVASAIAALGPSAVGSLLALADRGAPAEPQALAAIARDLTATLGPSPQLRRIGTRARLRFYVASSRRGICFAVAFPDRSTPWFQCATRTRARSLPVANFVAWVSAPRARRAAASRLFGFAADGVATVGVRDVRGRIHSTRVADNLYAAERLPRVPVKELIARDAGGNVVWRRRVAARPRR